MKNERVMIDTSWTIFYKSVKLQLDNVEFLGFWAYVLELKHACDTVEEPTFILVCISYSQMCGKQESLSTFLLSNKESVKRTEKYLFLRFLSTGGRLWKREGVITLSIHGFS